MQIFRRILLASGLLVALPTALGLPAPDDAAPAQARDVSVQNLSVRNVSDTGNVTLSESELAILGSGFLDNCWWVGLQGDGRTLEACCDAGAIGNWWTRIDLAHCLANRNGGLSATPDGNFQGSCRACNWIGGTLGLFSCYCDAPDRANLYTEITLVSLPQSRLLSAALA